MTDTLVVRPLEEVSAISSAYLGYKHAEPCQQFVNSVVTFLVRILQTTLVGANTLRYSPLMKSNNNMSLDCTKTNWLRRMAGEDRVERIRIE